MTETTDWVRLMEQSPASVPGWRIQSVFRRESAVPLFLLALIFALTLRIVLALAFPSTHRPDEIFQTIEPAYSLWKGWGVETWEWREGIRSWMFPGFLAAIMAMTGNLGPGVYLPAIAAVMSLLSLAVVATGIAAGWRTAGWPGAVIGGAAATIWPDLLFFAPRTLAEVQSGHLLIAAIGLWIWYAGRLPRRTVVVVGVLLALSFCLRMQLAPALALIAVWCCRWELRVRWLPLLLGGAVPLLGLCVLDWWTLGSPFQSVWKYFVVNLIEGRAGNYGVSPAWWYIVAMYRDWGIAIVPVALLFVLGICRLPLAAAAAIVIIASHSVVAHKELSFVYPAQCLIIVVASAGSARVLESLPIRGGGATVAATAAWFLLTVYTANAGMFPLRWQVQSDVRAAFSRLHEQPDMCGLTVYKVGTKFFSLEPNGQATPTILRFMIGFPSYSLLDKAVPSLLPGTEVEFQRSRLAANYILTNRQTAAEIADATIEECIGDICWLRTPSQCARQPDLETNTVLARWGY